MAASTLSGSVTTTCSSAARNALNTEREPDLLPSPRERPLHGDWWLRRHTAGLCGLPCGGHARAVVFMDAALLLGWRASDEACGVASMALAARCALPPCPGVADGAATA